MLRGSLYLCIFILGFFGFGRGGYDLLLGRFRLLSDIFWERFERRLDSSNWRVGGEDEDGWRILG